MRTESEMMDLILGVANEHKKVRAVAMNGSRVNKNAPVDRFQDYDIVYLVDDFDYYINHPNWIDIFGERMIMQTPMDMPLFPSTEKDVFNYLMLFVDGNRIDLTIIPIEKKDEYCKQDSLTKILLDKDKLMTQIPEATDQDYWVGKPSMEFYHDCCNEFFWVIPYVVKGLQRQEILYAIDHMNIIHKMILTMVEWKAGIDTEFTVSVGKNFKYLEKYVSEDIWSKLMKTYPSGDYDEVWKSLHTAIELFEEVAKDVANKQGFRYNQKEANNVKIYVEKRGELA